MSMPDEQAMRAEIIYPDSSASREEQLLADLVRANDRIAELERMLNEALARA
jgi:hypothetical protein